jgi:transcriptional regulator GlxA family with amidase domain
MAYNLQGLFLQILPYLRSRPYSTLDEVAERVHVERHTIEKAVKQSTGKTFRALRSELLLRHATGLLRTESNQSIKEIAFRLGYQSQRSFSRFIRTAAGRSPKEIRSQAQDPEQ